MITKDCTCAQGKHAAPVDGYLIDAGALGRLGEFIAPYGRVYMVADETTYRVAGARVRALLEEQGKLFSCLVLPEHPLPDYTTFGNILVHLNDPKADSDLFAPSPLPDLILAVGSGTVNDSCRLVAYRVGVPYGVVATAPSMDGYLSAGTPALFDGTKATIKCATPRFLVADTLLLKDAPWEMLLAGIGDMFGKYTGLLDWELARDYRGEYYCEKIAADVLAATTACLENGARLRERDPAVIKAVMEGFVVTGLGMAFTGTSRPASGAEHIVAHTWELQDVKAGRTPNLHGLEVCEATRLIADMYLTLRDETDDAHLKALIDAYAPYFARVETFCAENRVPAPVRDETRIRDSVRAALNLRKRYTILYCLEENGQLDRYAALAAERLAKKIREES